MKFGGRDAPSILGWSVEKVSVRWEKTLAEPDVDSFSKKISGMLVEDVQRRAKFIRIILCSAELVIHLRMSGDIRVESDALPLQPHDRLVVWFTNGFRLAFNDTRKFGRVWFLKEAANFFEGLGPEPLGGLTKNTFYTLLQRHHRQIKPLLMDQRVVAGLGNIYTDEVICFITRKNINENLYVNVEMKDQKKEELPAKPTYMQIQAYIEAEYGLKTSSPL